jgi:Fur family peroxide stress response transcriptional regulator
MESKEKIIDVLRRKGFRATPQRIAIAQTVLNSKDHPTAEQVFDIVKRSFPSISLSTVYNTLNSMRDVNMIQELAFSNNHRYDPNTSLHVNLICQNCGDIIDIENKTIENEVEKISMRRGVSITGHRFDIIGICRKCEIINQS